jgi:hypothetical protein
LPEKPTKAFANVETFWKDLFPVERNRLIRLLVEKIKIRETGIDMELKTNGLTTLITELASLAEGWPMKMKPTITVADNGNLQIHILMLIRRMRGRKQVIAPQALDGEIPETAEPIPAAVVQVLAKAFSWAEILESGQVKSISELARNLEVDGSYVTRILKLTTLAPGIVEAIINGEEPDGLSLAKLIRTFPED